MLRSLISFILFLALFSPNVSFSKASGKTLIGQGDRAFEERQIKDKLQEALDFYKEAQSDPSDSVEASWKYAMALQSFASRFVTDENLQMEYFHEGAEIAKRAAEQDTQCGPCEFWAAIHMAQYGERKGIVKMLGSLSEIISRLERAAELDPKHALAGPYRVLGTIYKTLPGIVGGDDEKAVFFFEKAIAAVPLEPINYLALAELRASQGETTLSKTIAQKGVLLGNQTGISVESQESLSDLANLSQ